MIKESQQLINYLSLYVPGADRNGMWKRMPARKTMAAQGFLINYGKNMEVEKMTAICKRCNHPIALHNDNKTWMHYKDGKHTSYFLVGGPGRDDWWCECEKPEPKF